MKTVTKIPPLKYLKDFTGVLAVREGEEMTTQDWDTNVSCLANLINLCFGKVI